MDKIILRRKTVNAIEYAVIVIFFLGMVIKAKETSAGAAEGLKLCLELLVPSLFPFFVLSEITVRCGLAEKAGRLFEKPMTALFNLPGACAVAFILGLVGGYPTGAKSAISLYEKGLCTKDECERLLTFCNNSGPAFILGVVGVGIFGSASAGILLYIAHILASITVGLIFRGKKKARAMSGRAESGSISMRSAIVSSVKAAGLSLFSICWFVIFFSVFIKLLYVFGIIPAISGFFSSVFGIDPAAAERFLAGFLELTAGISGFSGHLPGVMPMTLAAFMLGWAGLSVHMQVMDFICEKGLRVLPFTFGKGLHGIISAFYTFILTSFFPVSPAKAAFAPVKAYDLKSALLCIPFFAAVILALIPFRAKKH